MDIVTIAQSVSIAVLIVALIAVVIHYEKRLEVVYENNEQIAYSRAILEDIEEREEQDV